MRNDLSTSQIFNRIDFPKLLLVGFLWWKRKEIPFLRELFLTPDEKAARSLSNSIGKISIDKNNLSFDSDQYITHAATIFDACNGGGTTEADIVYVFGLMNTEDDIKQLVKSYGVRETFTAYISDGKKALPQLLRSELEMSDYPDIEQKLKSAGF